MCRKFRNTFISKNNYFVQNNSHTIKYFLALSKLQSLVSRKMNQSNLYFLFILFLLFFFSWYSQIFWFIIFLSFQEYFFLFKVGKLWRKMNQYNLHILYRLFFIFRFFSWHYQLFLFFLFLSSSLSHWQRCAENVYSEQRLQLGFNAETSIGKRIFCLYIQKLFSTYSYPYFPIYLFSAVPKISATLISPRLCFIFLILSCYFSLVPFSLTVSICFFSSFLLQPFLL